MAAPEDLLCLLNTKSICLMVSLTRGIMPVQALKISANVGKIDIENFIVRMDLLNHLN
jgi:hypothetical protein